MQRYYRHTLIITITLALISCGKERVIQPGIPLELAVERKQAIQDVRYDLFFDIPASSKDSIRAKATITFEWIGKAIDLQLDFLSQRSAIKRLKVNGKDTEIRYEQEHLIIEKGELDKKSNTITIDFFAGENALNRNTDYLYTLFVPSRASTCFPLFDQPDLKAVYKLELSIPSAWKAIANGKLVSSDSAGGKTHLKFSETKPTSSYQFAFAAGNFHEAKDPVSGMTMLYRETDSIKVAKNVGKIFELHRMSLAWLKEYTGIEYPYEKFDFALMPAFQFGGMEHPGSIFYRESSLFLEPSASVNEELRRAGLIAHETAHMWFGNLVTMKWFNDVWLKEVFANFMAAKIVSPAFPEVNHDLRFLMAHYPAAYAIDRSAGTHPVQQPLDNLRNAGSVYGAIIYQKAPIMMRNLETWIGADNFQTGLRDYLKTYSYQNATWDDLVTILKKYTKQDLEAWNKAWIKTAGMPEMEVTRDATSKFFVHVANDTSGIVWPQTFDYKLDAKYIHRIQPVTIRSSADALLSKWIEPDMRIVANYRGRGYGYFHSDVDLLLTEIPNEADVEARAGMWISLWEIFLHGEVPVTTIFGSILKSIDSETDPLLLEYVADKLSQTYWQFLLPEQRSSFSSDLDQRLFRRMMAVKDKSLKRTLFNTFSDVVSSKEGIVNLKKLWADEIAIGFDLSERDHIQLASALAIREVEGHAKILHEQLKRISNPDRVAEMEFVMPALSADPKERDLFFRKLAYKENLVREPWVLEGVRYLHHPLRQANSVQYVKQSLMMLEELQRTGDIFFPKGWLDATLGSYQSTQAADAVRAYLKENTGLRQDLRNKLLQSSDMLFRAEAIAGKNRALEVK